MCDCWQLTVLWTITWATRDGGVAGERTKRETKKTARMRAEEINETLQERQRDGELRERVKEKRDDGR